MLAEFWFIGESGLCGSVVEGDHKIYIHCADDVGV
jgi:hypothetical protein